MSNRIAICGAGIAGLTLAYQLRKAGHEVTLFEARDRPGGVIDTFERDGYQLESGPNTLLVRHREVQELIDELGLADQVVQASEAASTRYVVRDGKPRALPSSPKEALTTPLLSPAARLRVLLEPLIGRFHDDEIDETLAGFVERRLGPEVLAYLVDPFVGGIFAGNPANLSARHTFPTLVEFEESAGSIALGAIKLMLQGRKKEDEKVERRLISFQKGMGTLVDALAAELGDHLRLSTPVRKLRRDDDEWRVIFDYGKTRRGQSFDAVVLATPAHILPTLEWENAAPPAPIIEELAHLPYAPCSVVSLGFSRDQVAHPLDGFGMLIPKVENFHILGSLFVSSMFDGRAPKDQVLLTAFVGGARQPQLATEDEQTLIEMASLDLGRLLDITGQPTFSHVTRWRRAIPQYEVGHGIYLDHLERLERELPGIFFAGNYRDGVGVPDIIRQSTPNRRRIDNFLS